MKKKFLLFLLAIVAGVGTIFAESGKCGENLTWNLTGGVLTISGTGEMYDYAAFDVPWYSQRESITSLIIGNSVTRIGNEAFLGCSSLTSINIPNSVTSIGDEAFFDCSSLASVTIGNNVSTIEDGAFYGCSGLKSIEIPNSVTEIGYEAFSECTGLTSVTIGNNVSSIGDGAFSRCEGLTQVTLNSDAIVSTDYTQYSISNIFGYQVEEYIIGNRVTSIGHKAFYNYDGIHYGKENNLTSVTIGNSVTSIGSEAFYGCSNLVSASLSEGVTSIGDEAFAYCSSLSSITIPNSVTSIEHDAFYACSSLTSITIPEGVSIIPVAVFMNCSSLTSITIPEGITRIEAQAFSYCNSLTSINIPNSVTYIGSEAFSECSSLTSITITGGITCIETQTFFNCSSLTSISIPEGVTSIEPVAFSRCSSLTAINIPNSVTTIGTAAFSECESLTSVVLGSGITNLGSADSREGVFDYSDNITSLTCYAINPPTIHEWFDDNTIIYVPAESVSAYKSAEYWKMNRTILPIGTTPETDDIRITPSDNSAVIVWKAIANAASYELAIESSENTWKLVFDAEGILTSMENHAPARYNAPQGIQSADFSYTITGLASGTTYNVTITAKAANGSTLNTETASFTTTGEPHGIEDVNVNNTLSKKIIRDGNVYILRGDKTYTTDGQLVR